MHVIQDKKSGKVMYIDYTPSDALRSGKEVYAGFNEKTMEIGWTEKKYIPAYFKIDKSGKIIELNLEETVKAGHFQLAPDQKLEKGEIVTKTKSELLREGLLKLEDIKNEAIEYYSALAFAKRSQVIPDYKLQNAALGVYDAELASNYQATVKAFRDEFHRIKAEIEKAKTVEAIEAVKANYPEAIITGTAVKKDEKQTVKQAEAKKEATKELKAKPKQALKKAAKKKIKK